MKLENISKRYEWAKRHRRHSYRNWVDIDEKWFRIGSCNIISKAPPGTAKQYEHKPSHQPQVMFLSAIARPNKSHNFDGKIGIWPVVEKYKAKQTTANQTVGDELVRNITMDGETFQRMMIDEVFPSIWAKMSYAKKVTVQIDGARAHSKKTTLDMIKKAAAEPPGGVGPIIEIVFQVANSPDTNLNDLCFFYSLDKESQKYKKLNLKDIISTVQREYNNYYSDKLDCLWQIKTAVAQLIYDNQGRNNFDIPHGILNM